MKTPYSAKLHRIMFTLIFGLLVLLPIQAASVQAASGTTVSAIASNSTPLLGETFTVNITIRNVENLYGLDVTFRWNSSVLQVLNDVDLRLGVESHPDGVLHEISSTAKIEIIENTTSQSAGEYHIVATSVNPASSFSGSGNVAILTFNVTGLGYSGLELETELADYPGSGESANFIEHTDVAGSVSVIPEFPSMLMVAVFLVFATVAVAFSKKQLKRTAQIA
jgi:hypothetical protein